MAARESLNETLFHGTHVWLKPGDVIKPGFNDVYYEDAGWLHNRPDVEQIGAYATGSQYRASTYAQSAQHKARRRAADQPFQMQLLSPVYEVEPLSEHSDPLGVIAAEKQDFYRDLKGFKVKRIAEYVPVDLDYS